MKGTRFVLATTTFTQGIAPVEVRYIKLGAGGAWEGQALDSGTLEWGAATDVPAWAAAPDWTTARQTHLDRGARTSTATGATRELREFITLGSDTLWITFARDPLWWAFAKIEVHHRPSPAAGQGHFYRQTVDGWHSTDLLGQVLRQDGLSSALTRVAGYRQTICRVEAEAYLLRLLRGEEDPHAAAARAALAQLTDHLVPLIRQLHWSDFELLIDLILSRAGLRRVSRLGGTMKDHDLIVEQPMTCERTSVQVKSSADQKTFDRYAATFTDNASADRLLFICHSSKGMLRPPPDSPAVMLWDAPDVASQAVRAGLVDWLLERTV